MTNQDEHNLYQRVGRENPFRVPDAYFAQMPDRIMQRIAHRRRARQLRLWMGSAAASLLVAVGGWTLWQSAEEDDMQLYAGYILTDEDLDDEFVSNSEIAYYLTEADI